LRERHTRHRRYRQGPGQPPQVRDREAPVGQPLRRKTSNLHAGAL
jgi:hypothetical protein